MFKKRGLSAVVTTLLIILLAMVLIGIVWVVIRSVVSKGSADVNTEQFTLDLSIQSAYVDSTASGDIKVGVRRSPGGGDMSGIKFIFFDGVDSISIERNIPLGELETKVFAFDNNTEVPGITAGDEVSIVPLFESNTGTQKTAKVTDSREISGEIPDGGAGIGDYGGGDTENPGDTGTPQCSDLSDNDGDTLVDYPDDPDCTSATDDSEAPSLPAPGDTCSDDTDCDSGLKCDIGNTDECVLLCNGTWEQGYYEVGVYECDADTEPNGCNAQCLCENGFSPSGDGTCALDSPINSGIISLVWPENGNANRFKSDGLPKSQQDLIGYTTYSVNFTGSNENGCFGISSAWYYSDINISEIGLNVPVGSALPKISPSEQYNVWEAEDCGQ